MKEAKVNILSPKVIEDADAICFTSNGIVKSNGDLVMGAGVAKQFRDEFPWVAREIGLKVKFHGNHVYFSSLPTTNDGKNRYVFSFPTKHHWKNPSSLQLIEQSAKELVAKANEFGLSKVYLTRPGVGLGGLDWEKQVKPVIEKILDDRFTVTYL